MVSGQGHDKRCSGPAPGLGLDHKPSPHPGEPLADAEKPEAARLVGEERRLGGVEPDPIVLNNNANVAFSTLKQHGHLVRPGVLRGVCQQLAHGLIKDNANGLFRVYRSRFVSALA